MFNFKPFLKKRLWNILLLSKGLATTFKGFLEQIFNWRINKLLLPHNLYSCANHAPLFYCSCWHPFLAIRQTQNKKGWLGNTAVDCTKPPSPTIHFLIFDTISLFSNFFSKSNLTFMTSKKIEGDKNLLDK